MVNQNTYSRCVEAYLWHRYVPPAEVPSWLWSDFPSDKGNFQFTPKEAGERLDSLFDRLCQSVQGKHLVPISGGWDSRLILGALRERFTSSEIETVSFGCPGQFDFEIGRAVATYCGVRHVAIDLSRVELTWSDLAKSVQSAPWTYVPDGFFNALARKVAPEATAWIGFLGDPLTGGHFLQSLHRMDDHASYAASQRFSSARDLLSPTYTPVYPNFKAIEHSAPFVGAEWLDFCVRQYACIAPIVLSGVGWKGWTGKQEADSGDELIMTPFADIEWATYWLTCPRKLHEGQALYLEMARRKYPSLFSLPSKYSYGLHNSAILKRKLYRTQLRTRSFLHKLFPVLGIRDSKMDNYVDYSRNFRARSDYGELVRKSITVLKDHIDIPTSRLEGLWDRHRRGRQDVSRELLLLVGLALNLEVHKQNSFGRLR